MFRKLALVLSCLLLACTYAADETITGNLTVNGTSNCRVRQHWAVLWG